MRKTLLALILIAAVLTGPLAVGAQQPGKLPRIGVLEPYPAADPINEQIRQALRAVGYAEGRDIVVEWRYGDGQTAHLPAFATELARLKLDAIMAIGDLAITAARRATTSTPIIAGTDDLVGEGHVKSLARPGGNVTGVSILASELNVKRLELLKEAVPTSARVAVLWDPATGTFHLSALHAMARRLRVELNIQEVRAREDLGRALEAARAWHADALNVLASPLLHALRQPVIDQVARYRIPAIYQWGESAREGGFMAYGPTHVEVVRAMSIQLDRILKGAKPADLPVEQPTKFELVINLKTAKALGLTIPPSVLQRADEVIK